MFHKMGVFNIFAEFKRIHVCQRLFSVTLQTSWLQLYYKKDPGSRVFLRVLLNFLLNKPRRLSLCNTITCYITFYYISRQLPKLQKKNYRAHFRSRESSFFASHYDLQESHDSVFWSLQCEVTPPYADLIDICFWFCIQKVFISYVSLMLQFIWWKQKKYNRCKILWVKQKGQLGSIQGLH